MGKYDEFTLIDFLIWTFTIIISQLIISKLTNYKLQVINFFFTIL